MRDIWPSREKIWMNPRLANVNDKDITVSEQKDTATLPNSHRFPNSSLKMDIPEW